MRILLILIPLSLLVLGIAVWAFFWAVRSGQFEDMDAPAWRVLLDDDEKPPGTDDNDAARSGGQSSMHSDPQQHDND